MSDSLFANRTAIAGGFCMLVGLLICTAPAALGQDKVLQFLPAPPPVKSVSRDERAQLNAARDTKARMRATLEFAEARLSIAESLTAGQQYEGACAQLGNYQGLIENLLAFLNEKEPNKNRIRDTFKRLEMALRVHGARIEALRRVTPSEHAVNVKAILDFAARARTEALNSFFGNALASEIEPDKDKTASDQTSKETTPTPAALGNKP